MQHSVYVFIGRREYALLSVPSGFLFFLLFIGRSKLRRLKENWTEWEFWIKIANHKITLSLNVFGK